MYTYNMNIKITLTIDFPSCTQARKKARKKTKKTWKGGGDVVAPLFQECKVS